MAPDDAKPLSAATPGDPVGASDPPPLDSRYTQPSGRVFMTGTQALVRMLLDQARLDAAAGLVTGGLVSGYRGSPLATFDVELWRAHRHLDGPKIDFRCFGGALEVTLVIFRSQFHCCCSHIFWIDL